MSSCKTFVNGVIIVRCGPLRRGGEGPLGRLLTAHHQSGSDGFLVSHSIRFRHCGFRRLLLFEACSKGGIAIGFFGPFIQFERRFDGFEGPKLGLQNVDLPLAVLGGTSGTYAQGGPKLLAGNSAGPPLVPRLARVVLNRLSIPPSGMRNSRGLI